MDRVQTSAEQVLGYPDHLMKTCMEDYERRAHLEAMRLSGLKFMSVCSGIDAAGEALRLIQAAWKKADPGSPESWVTKTSFCDSGKEQQNFLVMLAELQELQTGCSPCVFTSIESRVPGDFCSEILQSPVPKSKAKARQSGGLTAADFEKLAKELEERPAEAFPRDARAHCLVHDQQCLVRPVRGGGAPSTLVETGASEDMFLFENVVEFPAREKIQDPLLETHHVIVLRLDPQDLGFPCHRPRLYVLGFNKLRIAWQHAVSESQRFLQVFGSACGVRGDVYMLDSWTSRRADMEAKMFKRGVHLSSSSLASEPASRSDRMRVIQSSVCPSSKQHGLLYEVEFAKQAHPADPSKQVPFFSDWEQHPVKGSSVAGPTVPCLLTHGTLVEHSSGKLMTLNEIFAVQGWGTLPTSGYPSDILETIKSAKCQPHHARTFIGNSMHIPTAMAVLLYAFSHMQSTRSLNDRAFKLMRRASSWNLEHGAGSSPSVSVQPMLEDDCDDGRGKKRKAPAFRRQTSNFCDMD